jgi:hypothetical protein
VQLPGEFNSKLITDEIPIATHDDISRHGKNLAPNA